MNGGRKRRTVLAGPVDDDALLYELRGDALREICGVEFDAEHESEAADVDDAVVTGCEFGELFVEEVADVANVVEQLVALDSVDDGDGDCAGQRSAAEGCAVHPPA